MKNTTTTDEDVTITEALKRLASQNITPARQSFDAAVKKGRIHDAPGTPDGKIRVSWESVLKYIEKGGFKPRGKADSPAMGSAEAPVAQPVTSNSVSPGNHSDQGHGKPDSQKSEHTGVGDVEAEPGDAQCEGKSMHHAKAKHQKSKSNHRGAPVQRPTKPDVKVESNESTAAKGRRTPPMRVLKNSLRHLDFDQTKAIRDWADNRLLTVLHPAATADTIA